MGLADGTPPDKGAEVTFSANDTTPSVLNANDFLTANSSGTSVTTFDDGIEGQLIRVRVNDANTTFVNGSTLKTGSGADLAAVNGVIYVFIKRGTVWYLISGPTVRVSNNTAPAVGQSGELLESSIARASEVSLTNVTPASITSITLTPGAWDVMGIVEFHFTATTSIADLIMSLSETTNSIDSTMGRYTEDREANVVFGTAGYKTRSVARLRKVVTVNTPVYLIAYGEFSASTLKAAGKISAVRV